MSVATLSRTAVGEAAVREALGTVVDPELDEPRASATRRSASFAVENVDASLMALSPWSRETR